MSGVVLRFSSPEVQRMLKALSEGRATESKPTMNDLTGRVVYPSAAQAAGVSDEAAGEVLEFLAREGILVREASESFHHCSACGSTRLRFASRCKSCGSPMLYTVDAVTHLKCGYTEASQLFATGKGLKCPSCGKGLKELGVDYRRVSNYYKCLSCGKAGNESRSVFRCQSCGASTDLRDSKLDFAYAYLINPDATERIRSKTVDLAGPRKVLAELGLASTLEARVRGKSGVNHVFSLAAWKLSEVQTDEPPDLVVDVATATDEVPDAAVSGFMVKFNDARVRVGLFVAVPGLAKEAEALAEFYGVQLVTCRGPEDVAGRLASAFESVAKSSAQPPAEEAAAPEAKPGAGPGKRDDSVALLMTLYERQNDSYNTLQRLVEQLKVSNSRLEELLGSPTRRRMAASE